MDENEKKNYFYFFYIQYRRIETYSNSWEESLTEQPSKEKAPVIKDLPKGWSKLTYRATELDIPEKMESFMDRPDLINDSTIFSWITVRT